MAQATNPIYDSLLDTQPYPEIDPYDAKAPLGEKIAPIMALLSTILKGTSGNKATRRRAMPESMMLMNYLNQMKQQRIGRSKEEHEGRRQEALSRAMWDVQQKQNQLQSLLGLEGVRQKRKQTDIAGKQFEAKHGLEKEKLEEDKRQFDAELKIKLAKLGTKALDYPKSPKELFARLATESLYRELDEKETDLYEYLQENVVEAGFSMGDLLPLILGREDMETFRRYVDSLTDQQIIDMAETDPAMYERILRIRDQKEKGYPDVNFNLIDAILNK